MGRRQNFKIVQQSAGAEVVLKVIKAMDLDQAFKTFKQFQVNTQFLKFTPEGWVDPKTGDLLTMVPE